MPEPSDTRFRLAFGGIRWERVGRQALETGRRYIPESRCARLRAGSYWRTELTRGLCAEAPGRAPGPGRGAIGPKGACRPAFARGRGDSVGGAAGNAVEPAGGSGAFRRGSGGF